MGRNPSSGLFIWKLFRADACLPVCTAVCTLMALYKYVSFSLGIKCLIMTQWHACYFSLSGKTITFARTVDIPRAAYNFRFFASSILHHTTECTQMDHMDCMHYTVRTPVGIGGYSQRTNAEKLGRMSTKRGKK